jgi:hypothetical protein
MDDEVGENLMRRFYTVGAAEGRVVLPYAERSVMDVNVTRRESNMADGTR